MLGAKQSTRDYFAIARNEEQPTRHWEAQEVSPRLKQSMGDYFATASTVIARQKRWSMAEAIYRRLLRYRS